VKVFDVGGERPFDVREAFRALWILTDFPHTDPFKLDLESGRVLGRLRVAGYPNYNDALATGFGSLWVRIVSGVKLVPSTGLRIPPASSTGSLLRIKPSR
jgi:hypothetical protein